MPLTGTELLSKIHELGDAPRDQVAIACGYVNDKTGKPAYTPFYEALMTAKGVTLAPPAGKAPKGRGKAPSYEVTINKQGVAPIGAAYVTQAGWAPGDRLRIFVDGGRIGLDRIATASEPAEAPAAACEAPVACPAPSPAAGAPAAAVAPF